MKKFFLILSFFLFPSLAFGAIAYPDSGSYPIASGIGSDSTVTLSATLSADVSKLIVDVNGRTALSGCTYNSVAMTLIDDTLSYAYSYRFVYYLDNPSVGSAYDIICTFSSPSDYRGLSYIGVSGTDAGIDSVATPHFATDGSMISTDITTTLENSDIIETVYTNNSALTLLYGTDQNQLIGIPADGVWTSIDQRSVTTADLYTVTVEPASGTPNQDTIVFSIPISTYVPPEPPAPFTTAEYQVALLVCIFACLLIDLVRRVIARSNN